MCIGKQLVKTKESNAYMEYNKLTNSDLSIYFLIIKSWLKHYSNTTQLTDIQITNIFASANS